LLLLLLLLLSGSLEMSDVSILLPLLLLLLFDSVKFSLKHIAVANADHPLHSLNTVFKNSPSCLSSVAAAAAAAAAAARLAA
jgi:hypothetical protein